LDNVDREMRITAVTHHYGVKKAADCSMFKAYENRGNINL